MSPPTPKPKPKPKDANHIAAHLLTLSHPPSTASQILHEKVIQRPLHLHPTSSTPDPRTLRRQQRRTALSARLRRTPKPRPLSARAKRALGVHDFKREGGAGRYEVFEGLNKLWKGYMREILGEGGRAVDGGKLAGCDYHGAEVEVVRSRCVGMVGIKGIVVRETRGTVVVVVRGGGARTVPKERTVFRVVLEWAEEEGIQGEEDRRGKDGADARKLVWELHGQQMKYRAVDRASRKFKPHFLPDL